MALIPKKYYLVSGLLLLIVLTLITYIVVSVVFSYNKPPKLIWTYWNDTNIPPLVEKIMSHRARVLKGWTQVIVTDATIKQYVNPPDAYYTLGQTHKSDWLRLALIKKYGGCWMDATIIVNSVEALDKIYEESNRRKSEFTGFYTPLGVINDKKSTFIESWCILAPRNSPVIDAWLDEYVKACNIGFLEYRKSAMKVHDFSPHIYNPDNEDVYLTVYAACQIAIQKRLSGVSNILLYNSYDTMYKLHWQCWDEAKKDYDHDCIANRIRDDPSVKQMDFIKITGHTRKFLDKIDVMHYFD